MLANIRHLLELIAEKIGFDRMNAIYRYKSRSQRKATQITFLHVYFTKTLTCDQWTEKNVSHAYTATPFNDA